jgi:hypothetical protein
LTGRPKGPSKPKEPKKAKAKKRKKGDPEPEEASDDVPPEPVLDFGDEIAQMESTKK